MPETPRYLLDDLFPRPMLVQLAGEPYLVSELTLGDLATLQGWLRSAAPSPLAGLPRPTDDPDPASRPDRLRAAWWAAKAYPPELGTDEETLYFASAEGRIVFLLLCLGKHDETIDAERAADLAARMTAEDWTQLRRVAYRVPVWRELAAELDPDWAEDQIRRSETPDWGERIISALKMAGHDYTEVERWTPTQLRAFLTGGRAPGYRAVRRPGETDTAMGARIQAIFTGPTEAAERSGSD